jgi:hypothetical protein
MNNKEDVAREGAQKIILKNRELCEKFLEDALSQKLSSQPLFARPTALTTTSALYYTSRSTMNWCTTWLMRLLSHPKAKSFADNGLVLVRM